MSDDKPTFSLTKSDEVSDKKKKKEKKESNPSASPEVEKSKKEKKKKHLSKDKDEKYSNIGILLAASPSKENVSTASERRNSQSSSPKIAREIQEPKSPNEERRERRKSNASSATPKPDLEQEALRRKYYSGDYGEVVKASSEGGNDEEVNPPVQERKKTLKEKLGIKFPTLTRSKSHNKEEESKKSKEPVVVSAPTVPTSPEIHSARRTVSGKFKIRSSQTVDKALVKVANDILDNWSYSIKPEKSKIVQVINALFVPMKELTGQLSLPESEFIRLFEGRLGSDKVVKRIFMYFDAANEGALDPKQFWNGLGLLDAGSEEEKLRLLFYAYDDDDSGTLESNELDTLLESAQDRLVSVQNLSKEEADTYVSRVRGKLDPSNEGVRRDTFVERSLSLPNFVGALIPPNLLRIDVEQWTNVFRNIREDSIDLSETTHELLTLMRANRDEDTHRIKTLIKDYESLAVDLNAQDHFGYTPLHYAIVKDRDMYVTMLLQNKVDVKKKYKGGMTALHAAAEKGKERSLKFLLDNGAEVNGQDENGLTPLHYCMKAEKAEVGGGIDNCIIELIRWEADLNIADKDGCTVLAIAARYGQPEYIELLVEKGCKVEHLSKGNFTPLHWAAHNGSVMCVKKLLALGADPNARTSSDATPLHLAAEGGSLNCLELLIEAKAEVYSLDKKKRTPLHMAAANGNIRCVKFLIKHSPEALKIKDVEGDTPKHTAQKRNNRDAAKIISDGPIQEQSEEVKLLLKTFREGDADTVMELMKKPNVDIHAANENGTSLLHYAAMQGREDIITLLIDRGVDPNIGNNRHTTPLHKAAQRGELKCLIALLQSGADINAQDDDGVTPLHRALRELSKGAQPGVTKCVHELINNKAKLNLSDKDGCFALDLASRYGLTELIGPLVEAGGDIHHKSKNGYEPIHWAAANGNSQTIKELVQNGAVINIYQVTSETDTIILPLNLAIQNNHIEAVEVLKRLKADFTLADSSERTPLHEAASSKNLRMFSLVVESIESKGSDNFIRKDKEGNTPLHDASLQEIVQQLIQYGGNVHAENKNEETPLLVAASRGNTAVVESLVNHSSDFNKVNKYHQNALYLAAKGGHTDCVVYLKSIGLKFTEQTDATIKYEHLPEAVYPVVKAATLERLIEHLVYNKYADEKFLHTFFTVFRKYISPQDLLEKLLNMLHVHRPTVHKNTVLFSSATKDEPHSTSQLKLADSKVTDLNSVKLPPGPAYTISFWIKHYFNDFDERSLAETFLEHMRTHKVSLGHTGRYLDIVFSDKFEETVKGKSSEHLLTRTHSFNAGYTQAVRVDQTDAKTMAQQMTLIESKLFSAIEYQEFLSQNWTKHPEKATNILAAIKHFNQASSWMVTEIVTLERKADRVKLIKKLIRIANYCYEMHNFQTVMQVISALENAAVARLKKTWQDVGAKSKNLLATLKTKMSQEKNYKSYRALLCSLTGPCVPFLGITLSDLTFTDENPEFITEEGTQLINFEKYMLVHQIISDILRHQQPSYAGFEPNQAIASYLYNIVTINDKQAFERSLKIEPRDNKV